jgi:hypothetical protein
MLSACNAINWVEYGARFPALALTGEAWSLNSAGIVILILVLISLVISLMTRSLVKRSRITSPDSKPAGVQPVGSAPLPGPAQTAGTQFQSAGPNANTVVDPVIIAVITVAVASMLGSGSDKPAAGFTIRRVRRV